MKVKNFTLLFLMINFIISCATKVPMNREFYNEKKVGVIVNVDPIGKYKTGAQGLLDMAISSGAKYKKGLEYVGSEMNPKKLFTDVVVKNLDKKNKSYVFITDSINFNSYPRFNKPEKDLNSNRKYYSKNLTELKEKYKVDQLFILNVRYGLTIQYYSMIEIDRGGSCNVDVELVNLDDNSLLYKDYFGKIAPLRGKWDTPPNYEILRQNIQFAVNESLQMLDNELDK